MPQAEKPSPLVGEGGGGEADERGKLEKKRKNRNTCEQNTTTILTCVRTLAPFASQAGTSLRVRGKLTLRKKKIIVFIFLYTLLTISYAGFFAPDHTLFECFGPLRMLTTAQEWRQEWITFSKSSKWLLPKKESIRSVSRPRLSGKVSAELTEGASVIKQIRNIF